MGTVEYIEAVFDGLSWVIGGNTVTNGSNQYSVDTHSFPPLGAEGISFAQGSGVGAPADGSLSVNGSPVADTYIQVVLQNSPLTGVLSDLSLTTSISLSDWSEAYTSFAQGSDYILASITSLTQVPEPSILALFSIGLAGAGFRRCRGLRA